MAGNKQRHINYMSEWLTNRTVRHL